ncbi:MULTISPECIES: alpha/beta fold hydrolase [Actinomadura]|uniref:Alpha/beta fold hydrolase n=1 Tax=Actinomadura yumaensis TaxID=111807 RepID=A0ABW2CHW8_9ACTN|nr:alpha/beta hydrolase [Actinomadura sp. J1-007]MWK34774.1 alpha/beta fold hydrolase [Actinomadura sp. J1-007]
MTTIRTIDVRGARLHCEIRGSGPLLLLMGSPMPAAPFAGLADALAAERTVVTHDPRGIAGSPLDDPEEDSTPDLRADDVAAVMDALGAESADVFGSSGGAVTGLALAARHPARVRTLVAHEPPLMELLPDAAEQRAEVEELVATFHREGVVAAWRRFMSTAGFDSGEDAGPPPGDDPGQDLADGARFFGHELLGTATYVPDFAALAAGPFRVVVGVGAESRGLSTYRTSEALAERLGTSTTEFPGDHGGFMGHPKEFADVLREVLKS